MSNQPKRGRPRKLELCETWLSSMLSNGKLWSELVIAKASKHDPPFQERLLKTAKANCRFSSRRERDVHGQFRVYWFDPTIVETDVPKTQPVVALDSSTVRAMVNTELAEREVQQIKNAKREVEVDPGWLVANAKAGFLKKRSREDLKVVLMNDISKCQFVIKQDGETFPLEEEDVDAALLAVYGPESSPPDQPEKVWTVDDFFQEPETFLQAALDSNNIDAIGRVIEVLACERIPGCHDLGLMPKEDHFRQLLNKIQQLGVEKGLELDAWIERRISRLEASKSAEYVEYLRELIR